MKWFLFSWILFQLTEHVGLLMLLPAILGKVKMPLPIILPNFIFSHNKEGPTTDPNGMQHKSRKKYLGL